MLRWTYRVEIEVPLRPRDCTCGRVDRNALPSPARCCGDGESARVREQIQHAFSSREITDAAPIFALVEKDSGRKAVVQSHAESKIVFANRKLVRRARTTRRR